MNYLKEIFAELKWAAVLLAALIAAPRLLLWIDPTTAQLDLGVLQLVLLGAWRVFISLLLLWATLKIGFGTVWNHLFRQPGCQRSGFAADFDKAPPVVRLILCLAVVLSVLAFVTAHLLSL